MMNEIFLLKMGEIVLKGLNRRRFDAGSPATSAGGRTPTAASASMPASPPSMWSPWRRAATWTGPGRPSSRCSGWPG